MRTEPLPRVVNRSGPQPPTSTRLGLVVMGLCALLLAMGAGCNVLTGADEVIVGEPDPISGTGGTGTGTSTSTSTSSGGSGAGSGLTGGAGAAGGQTGGGGATVDPCAGIDCGANGQCAAVADEPTCDCDEGYHAAGLTCEQDVPPGPCDGVTCGASAGCIDGICECNDGYEGDAVAGCTAIDPTEADVRAELVAIAEAELGYCEGVDERPYMLGQPGLWCYDFVAWVYNQSSYPLPSPLGLQAYYVGELPEWWRPEPGDLIKFTIQHYGMVRSVSADGQVITTVEGNFNSCVMSRSISDPSVEYYGTLDSVL